MHSLAGALPKTIQERQDEKARANTIEEGLSNSFENALAGLPPEEPVVGELTMPCVCVYVCVCSVVCSCTLRAYLCVCLCLYVCVSLYVCTYVCVCTLFLLCILLLYFSFIELLMFYCELYWMFYVNDKSEGKYIYYIYIYTHTETIKLYCNLYYVVFYLQKNK